MPASDGRVDLDAHERTFSVLASPRHARVVVRLTVESIGASCEFVCRQRARGLLQLVTGWSRGAETRSLWRRSRRVVRV